MAFSLAAPIQQFAQSGYSVRQNKATLFNAFGNLWFDSPAHQQAKDEKTVAMKTSCCRSNLHVMTDQNTLICRNPDCSHFLLPTVPHYRAKTWNYLFMGFFFVFFFIFPFNDFSSVNGFGNQYKNRVWGCDQLPLNPDNLKQEILDHNILCPDEVFAQIMLESGNLHSFLLQRTIREGSPENRSLLSYCINPAIECIMRVDSVVLFFD